MKIEKIRIVVTCILLSVSLFLQSQNRQYLSPQTDSLAKFIRNIVTFNQMFPQEKVFLHFDNTGYFMGETIWFKAYVVNPINNRPNILSKVLYVELLTPEGRVIQSQKLKIENGQCNGQLSLAQLLHPGFYEVRAYTALMLNWEECPVFSRVFPIFNAPQTEEEGMYEKPRMLSQPRSERLPEMRAKRPNMEKINLNFFPEGGHLIEECSSNVAFKATDSKGNPISVQGNVYNDRREKLVALNVIHDGMGLFSFTPQKGENYYAEISINGTLQRFNLPQAESRGYSMSIDNLSSEQLTILLTRNEVVDTTRVLAITGMSRGKITLFKPVVWQGKSTITLSFDKKDMPEGVNQFTLFDTQGNIYAERLAFIPPFQSVHFFLEGNKGNLQPKEKVEMKFKLTDTQGHPVRTMFSLAVRDAATETPSNESYGTIAANLLLGSELKGYIHDINYYFEADDSLHRLALDLLLCTQGWRRYNWKQMSEPQNFQVKYPAEEGLVIMGDLTSTFRNRVKDGVDMKVFLYNGNGERRVGSCRTDSLGKFAFLAEDFTGRWIMHMQTYENEKLKEMNVNLKKVVAPQPRFYNQTETTLYDRKSNNKTEVVTIDTLRSVQEQNRQQWENLLPTVKVESSKEWQSQFVRQWNNMIYDMEDERIRMDETGEHYLENFYDWLEDNNPFFTYTTNDSGFTARYKGRPVRFFVSRIGTGKWLTNNDVSIDVCNLSINDVEAIAISDKSNAELAMSRFGYETDSINGSDAVIVSLFIRNDYFRYKDKRGHRRTKVQGYSPIVQFYMPDYSYTDLPNEKDFRRTLYWAPYVTTDEQGEAIIRFYNNETCKRMKISATTITFGGIMGDFETEW
ncbi:MAG: hypothetical protein IJ417_09715 [Bacteroidaceae bacterium]|nr:hypothetical protein [Bacteroidaceae bacterium]